MIGNSHANIQTDCLSYIVGVQRSEKSESYNEESEIRHMLGKCVKQKFHLGLLAVIIALLSLIYTLTAQNVHAASGDWPTYLANNAHTGFNSSETIINRSTAAKLKLHWTHTSGSMISTQPTVANGTIYWGSWGIANEHATALNNARVWVDGLGNTTDTQCNPVTVGVASTATIAPVVIGGQTTLVDFVGGGDAHFYALNAATGTKIWSTLLGSSPSHFIWSSPAVFNGSVYVGLASFGDCPLVQGQVIQLNASTGAIQHTFNVVPNGCTGGGVWGAPTIDQANGTIYFATGNPGACSSSETFSVSFIEVKAADLSLVHYWHVPSNEQTGDGDFGSTATLFTATVNGVVTSRVGIANKNGIYYAFNRNNISAGPVWRAKVAIAGGCPQCGDGSISPAAWDGTTLYVAGGTTTIKGSSCKGGLRAVNPATGAFIWEHCMLAGPILGAVSAVPGVIVVGEGNFVIVVDAVTSATLFRYQDPNANSVFWGAASISNGVIYIGNQDGLYALGL